MWVFAGGMFRSGSTLQFQIVADLVERAGLGERCRWMMPDDFAEYARRSETGTDRSQTLRVFKTHVCKHAMRERLRDGRARAVRCHRDLRDVVASAAQKAGVEPSPEYARELIEGNLACDNGWPDVPSVRSWSYELLTRETRSVVLEMAEHLSVPCDDSIAGELAMSYRPEQQSVRIERAISAGEMRPAVGGGMWCMRSVSSFTRTTCTTGRSGNGASSSPRNRCELSKISPVNGCAGTATLCLSPAGRSRAEACRPVHDSWVSAALVVARSYSARESWRGPRSLASSSFLGCGAERVRNEQECQSSFFGAGDRVAPHAGGSGSKPGILERSARSGAGRQDRHGDVGE